MRLHAPSLILGGALVSSLAVSGWAMAKQECPAESTCYSGHVLEFDPNDGPIQFLVVRSTSLTTTTLDGQSVAGTATLVEFVSDGDRYTQRGDPLDAYPKVGVLANANTGDTFGLAEVTGAD